VLGPLFLLRRVLPLLEESRGFLLQVSAVVAERPMPRMAAYSASKAALSAVAAALRTELRRSRVEVYDVRPPHTETGLADRPLAGEAPRLPTGKDPADVARRIVDALAAGEQDLGASAFE
jgi:cyclic-di-GMP-binding biofilm dispersal mediator protein